MLSKNKIAASKDAHRSDMKYSYVRYEVIVSLGRKSRVARKRKWAISRPIQTHVYAVHVYDQLREKGYSLKEELNLHLRILFQAIEFAYCIGGSGIRNTHLCINLSWCSWAKLGKILFFFHSKTQWVWTKLCTYFGKESKFN